MAAISAPTGGACTVTEINEGANKGSMSDTIITPTATGTNNVFTLEGTDADQFDIVEATGAVTLKDATSIDYETLTNKYLTVVIV